MSKYAARCSTYANTSTADRPGNKRSSNLFRMASRKPGRIGVLACTQKLDAGPVAAGPANRRGRLFAQQGIKPCHSNIPVEVTRKRFR
ncbi:MAG: hypothetical protein WCP12_03120 [bacterium]